MEWHYAKNGAQRGPVSTEDLKRLLQTGEISATDLVWKEGMSDWLPLAQIPELSSPANPVNSAAAPVAATPPPSPAGAPLATGQAIPNHLVWAILSTVLCCPPFGIASIVYAVKVEGLVASGQIAEAQKASDNAKKWAWISFGVGIAVNVIVFAVTFAGAATGV